MQKEQISYAIIRTAPSNINKTFACVSGIINIGDYFYAWIFIVEHFKESKNRIHTECYKKWKLISHDLFYGTFEYISICSFLEYLKIERMSLKNVIAANGYAVLFHKRRFSYFPLVQYKRDFLHKR